MIIEKVGAKLINNSRGNPTIEVTVNGCKASSPSGKSTGEFETKPYYKNLNWNIKFLNSWKQKIEINNFKDLEKIEENIKKKLRIRDVKDFGANALFAFESAILKALAKEKKVDLWQIINQKSKKIPLPVGNIIGGGLHSSKFKVHPNFQEFLIIPKTEKFSESYKILSFMHKKIKKIIKSNGKNDEGAWQSKKSDLELLDILETFSKKIEKEKNVKIGIGLDVASSSLYENKNYNYMNKKFNKEEQINFIIGISKKYNLEYIEDPLQEKDFEGFSEIKKKTKSLIVGDDLTASQINRVKKAIKEKSINSIIIKPNQNGSFLEIKKIFDICKKNNIKTILSHRSGETMDDAIADYSFGFEADYIKTGISTKWRKVKLERLLKIEKKLNSKRQLLKS
jgi:enolase